MKAKKVRKLKKKLKSYKIYTKRQKEKLDYADNRIQELNEGEKTLEGQVERYKDESIIGHQHAVWSMKLANEEMKEKNDLQDDFKKYKEEHPA